MSGQRRPVETPVVVDADRVAWPLLREQKGWLLKMRRGERRVRGRAVVHLIDYLQDQAAEVIGEKAVFGTEAKGMRGRRPAGAGPRHHVCSRWGEILAGQQLYVVVAEEPVHRHQHAGPTGVQDMPGLGSPCNRCWGHEHTAGGLQASMGRRPTPMCSAPTRPPGHPARRRRRRTQLRLNFEARAARSS